MFRLIWTISVRTRDYLHRYMPSNRLLAAIRTRRGLKWGIPAMLVALPYILIASICSSSAADGGPGWLHLIVLWACWNALKFIIMGPVSVALLIRARLREAPVRRHQRHGVEASIVLVILFSCAALALALGVRLFGAGSLAYGRRLNAWAALSRRAR